MILGFSHAILMALAFEPALWFIAFIAPLPLFMLALYPNGSPKRVGMWAAIGVIPLWVYTHAWIGSVSAAGLYPLVLYMSVYTWFMVVVGHQASRSRLPAAVSLVLVWCGLEFFRAQIAWAGYPWYMLGHPMIESPASVLAWPAAIGGVPLVSALVACPAAWWVTRRVSSRRIQLAVSTAMLIWVLSGMLRQNIAQPSPPDPFRVGVVQTNIPQDNRMDWTTAQRLVDWQEMRDLTVDVARSSDGVDLIVWPEGLVPGWTFDPVALKHERDRGIVWRVNPSSEEQAKLLAGYGPRVPATRVVDEILAMQRALDIPMLVGAAAYDNLRIVSSERGGIEYENDAMYNSAFLVQNGQVGDVWYDKLHLTPFGEVMPYISAIPWLEDRLLSIGAEGMAFALSPGRSAKTITAPSGQRSVELATPICFEATMPSVCRRLANIAHATGHPVVLVNISNDGWFGSSDRGRSMHQLGARWRCVELRLPMVRSANTGISSSISAQGQVLDTIPPREAGSSAFEVQPGISRTIYSRVGEWFGWAAMLGLVPMIWFGKGRNSHQPAMPADSNTRS